ncbi:MAG: nlpI [Phycisphaerales bacterium]|nr:nlpI [Phycisphaerales bacterium]
MRIILIGVLLLGAVGVAADDSLLREAEQSYAQGRHDQAIELTDLYIAGSPKEPKGYLLRAVIRSAESKWEDSLPDFDKALELNPKLVKAYQRRAIARFMLGRIKESVADFDKYNQLDAEAAPQNWQRGIALYYAGRYEDGAKQFELHRTVNPDDVENAAWHFLCVARWKNVEAARAALIPIQGDTRIPMAKVHEMFAGKATPEEVIATATAKDSIPIQINRQYFYAHLYIGLYCEAIGKNEEAKQHLTAAVKHEVPDYMYGVAKVHLQLLDKK